MFESMFPRSFGSDAEVSPSDDPATEPRGGFSQWILGSIPGQGAASAFGAGRADGAYNGSDGRAGTEPAWAAMSAPHPFQREIDALDSAIAAHRRGDMEAFQTAMDELFRAQDET